jgi:hypothetical protein
MQVAIKIAEFIENVKKKIGDRGQFTLLNSALLF